MWILIVFGSLLPIRPKSLISCSITTQRLAAFIVGLCLVVPCHGAKLRDIPSATLKSDRWNDGDSFLVNTNAQPAEPMKIRLYYVDCPETVVGSNSDKRRVRAQARYFGVPDFSELITFGNRATSRSAELMQQPFTLHTANAKALGRSKQQRYYGMITLHDGRDLAAVLVMEGLARTHGLRRTRPDGTASDEYQAYLRDLELGAAIQRKGIWSKSDPDAIAVMRKAEREEAAELDRALEGGVFSAVSEDDPVDINHASSLEIQQLKGIGPKLAEKIIAGRPYGSIEELKRVNGIGKGTVKRIRGFVKVRIGDPTK